MRNKSIVDQLTGWYMFCLFVSTLVATLFLYLSLAKALRKEDVAVIQDRLQTVISLLQRPNDPIASLKRRIESEWPSRKTAVFVRILSADGTPQIESPGIPAEVVQNVFENPIRPDSDQVRIANGHTYLASEVRFPNPISGASVIRIALDVSGDYSLLEGYRNRLLLVLLFSLLISALVGRRLAKAALRPVQRIAEAARRIRSSTLHERIQGLLPVELQPLSSTINEMLDRLEESFGRLNRFSSDLAHELRTPLNNLRGEMEVALGKERDSTEYREVLGSCLEETNRLTKIIDSLLFVAKAETSETQIKREALSIRTEIERVVEFYEVSAAEDEVKVQVDVPPELELEVERTLFQRALANILSNAISHSRKGDTVLISATSEAAWIHIQVQDHGEGISKEKLAFIFDRLYRADPSRKAGKYGGFGLGLTIVKSILKLHDGEVSVESELGKGTTVRLSFPRGGENRHE